MTHSSSSSQDSTYSVFQFPQGVSIAKNHSPQAALPIQSHRCPALFDLPRHRYRVKTYLHRRSQHSTHETQAGPIQYPAAAISSASGDLPKFEPAYLSLCIASKSYI